MDENDILVLKKTLDFTANGTLPTEADRVAISSQLTHLQERYDLSGVALANYHMKRAADLAEKIVNVESDIFMVDNDGKLPVDLPFDLRLKIWQELQKQLNVSTEFIDAKASTPSVSSPERMGRVAKSPDEEDEAVKQLPPDSRRKVMEMLKRMKALPELMLESELHEGDQVDEAAGPEVD